MLLLGHAGITLAAGMLFQNAIPRGSSSSELPTQQTGMPANSQLSTAKLPTANSSSLVWLKEHFDYRFLLVGSLLPDLLDKPIGQVFFYNTFQSGRIFGHTLCFNLLLLILGIYVLRKWRKTWLLILSFGSIIHLLCDRMWLDPEILLWPAYGWSFPKLVHTSFFAWLPQALNIMEAGPYIQVSEAIGGAILIWFTARLIYKKQVRAFITTGMVI